MLLLNKVSHYFRNTQSLRLGTFLGDTLYRHMWVREELSVGALFFAPCPTCQQYIFYCFILIYIIKNKI